MATVTGFFSNADSYSGNSGSHRGGYVVYVKGTGFTGATTVTVGGVSVAFTIFSDTQINITSMPAAATPGFSTAGDVVVNGSATSSADIFYYTPHIDSVSPSNYALKRPGTNSRVITITGTGFTGITQVRFGRFQNTFIYSTTNLTVVSSTTITMDVSNAFPSSGYIGLFSALGVNTPVFSGGFLNVNWTMQNSLEGGTSGTTLTTANTGGSSGNAFNYIQGTPAFSTTTPAHGSLSGSFQNGYAEWSPTAQGMGRTKTARMYFILPTTGIVGDLITMYTVDSRGYSQNYWYVQLSTTGPYLANVLSSGGHTQTFNGGNSGVPTGQMMRLEMTLTLDTAFKTAYTATIFYGDTATVWGTISASNLTSNGNAIMTAWTDFGQDASGATLPWICDDMAVSTGYAAATPFGAATTPTVTAINPSSGPAYTSNTITVTGTNFLGATSVTIAGVASTSFTVDSATQITATMPSITGGTFTAPVLVTNAPYGTSSGGPQYTWTVATLAGAASLLADSTLTTGAAVEVFGDTALTASANLTTTGQRIVAGSAALIAAGTLGTSASLEVLGSASLVAVSTLSPVVTLARTGTAALIAAGTLGISTTLVATSAASSLVALSTLSAAGVRAVLGAAALIAAGTLSTAGVVGVPGAAPLVAVSTLSAVGTLSRTGVAALIATAVLTASPSVTALGAASLAAAAVLSTSSIITETGAVALVAASILSSAAASHRTSLLPPDAILEQANLTGALSTITDDPDAPDGTYMTAGAGADVLRVSFPTPAGTLLTGTYQEFRVLVRRGSS